MECDAYWDYSGWYVALSADGSRVAISAINHGNPPGAGAGKRELSKSSRARLPLRHPIDEQHRDITHSFS